MENQNKINNDILTKEPKQKLNKLLLTLTILAIISTICLTAALWWALEYRNPDSGNLPSTPSVGSGPCFNGAANALPPGYTWYENTGLGFKFAYPSAWGTVAITDTPTGGVAGHYLQGSFSANDAITFGGNATDYVVSPRGGMPTDNPGYLQATNKFYTVQFWRLNDPSTGTSEEKYALYPIEGDVIQKDGCNTKAAVSQYPETEFMGHAYDVVRFNLQPENIYYGVNFVAHDPTVDMRADIDKIIRSFQLLP